jgi:hypothetical protein
MIKDARDALFSIGGATVLTALAGLALDNTLILTIGLRAAGVTLLAYGAVALAIAGANVVQIVRKAVAK